jgi:excisionase family DNA binding protein
MEEAMNELHENTPDLSTELRLLRQAIGDLAVIMTAKRDLSGPAVLDMKDAATYLSTTRHALYDIVERGIPCRRLGRKYLFLKADLDAWLQQLPGITVAQAIAAIQSTTKRSSKPHAPRRSSGRSPSRRTSTCAITTGFIVLKPWIAS